MSKYIQKRKQIITVITMTPNSTDEDGKKIAGVVIYKNEFDSKVIMTYDQFNEKFMRLEKV